MAYLLYLVCSFCWSLDSPTLHTIVVSVSMVRCSGDAPPTIPSFVCRGYAVLACGTNFSAHLTPWKLTTGANNMLSVHLTPWKLTTGANNMLSVHLTPWELTTGANNMLSATSRLLLLSEAGSSMSTLPTLCLWYCAKNRSLLAY